jgi:hypothetical protein
VGGRYAINVGRIEEMKPADDEHRREFSAPPPFMNRLPRAPGPLCRLTGQ